MKLEEITLKIINDQAISNQEKDYFDYHILNESGLKCFDMLYPLNTHKVTSRSFSRMNNKDNLPKLYKYFDEYELDQSQGKDGNFYYVKEQGLRNEIFDPKYKALFMYFNRWGYSSRHIYSKEIFEHVVNLHYKYKKSQNDNFKSYISNWIRDSEYIPENFDKIVVDFLNSEDHFNKQDLLGVLLIKFDSYTKHFSSNTLNDLYQMIDLLKSRCFNEYENTKNHLVVRKKELLQKMRDDYLSKVSQELKSRNDGVDLNYLLL